MSKYPLDHEGIANIAHHLLRHDEEQRKIIKQLVDFLREAMTYIQDEPAWCEDAEELIQTLHRREMDFSNFRFDQTNGHKLDQISPYLEDVPLSSMFRDDSDDDVMSEEELAKHFNEPLPKRPKKELTKGLNKMSLEEIKEWEASQDNSNDIYKIAARIKNEARGADGSLTTVGVSLCNTFTHMLKSLYDFAATIQDADTKIKLTELIRKQEKVPGQFIRATHAGVQVEK